MRDYKALLKAKLLNEFSFYRKQTLSLSNEEIFDKCYEITCLKHLQEFFIDNTSSSELVLMKLCNMEDVLSYLYLIWMHADTDNLDEMINAIDQDLNDSLNLV